MTSGHPDKICDAISDAVLDEALRSDPYSRVACETMVKDDHVVLAGEITTKAHIDYEAVVKGVIDRIGYTEECGFSSDSCEITLLLREQSPDIAVGVDSALESKDGGEQEIGAGDQGMMFGFSCNETNELMPLAISLAHRLCRRLEQVRKTGEITGLRPDGKAQVTVEYKDGRPRRIHTVVLSTQHSDELDIQTLRERVEKSVIRAVIPKELIDKDTRLLINPTGRFVIGGPVGDSGLTGRKIIVDTYGGYARHGGGAFSGKDATKVDRSAAYMARYIAKNIVAAGLAERCEIQLSYAIGVAAPVSVAVDTFGTGKTSEERIEAAVGKIFDMRPGSIIKAFGLRNPIFGQLSAYGHMGREDIDAAWEKTDMAKALAEQVGSF